MRHKNVAVVGLIGSGKTTLSQELAQTLGALWLSEPDEKNDTNPYLADYYKEPVRWAFTLQVHMLGLRLRQQLHAQWHVMNGMGNAVLDSSYWQDTAFARLQLRTGLMSEREFQTYSSIYQAMTASVMLPSILIRVLTSPEVCQNRVRKRMEKETGRKCESVIDLSYLQGLETEIDHMVNVLRAQGVTVMDVPWDTDRDTPESRSAAIEALAHRIQSLSPPDFFLNQHRRTL